MRLGWMGLPGVLLLLAGCVVPAVDQEGGIPGGAPLADAHEAFGDALRHLSSGRQSDAEALVAAACKEHPGSQPLWFLRGVLERSRFDKPSAFACFAQVHALGSGTGYGKAALASSSMDMGLGVDAGFGTLRELIALHPDDLLLRWLFAIQCRAHRRHPEEAAMHYGHILRQWDPGPALVHQTYANILAEALGRPEDALEHRWIAAELEPKSWTYQGLANTLKALGRHEEAFAAYAKMTELDPADADYWRQWGMALYEAGFFADAAGKFRKALECAPAEVSSLLFLGRSLERQGLLAGGFACYERAVEVDPDDKFARVYAALSKLYGYGTEPDFGAAGELASPLGAGSIFHPVAGLANCIAASEQGDFSLAPERIAVLHAHLEALAEQGNAAAGLVLGRIYRHGLGVDTNGATAAAWLERVLASGCSEAAVELASLYELGIEGLERCREKAFAFFLMAAEAGDCRAMHSAGRYYLVGIGTEPDLAKAIEWLDRCGEMNKCRKRPYSLLGSAYMEGKWGAPQDWWEAERWFSKGARQGEPGCLQSVGSMHERGNGDFPRDLRKAIDAYRRSWAMNPRSHRGARLLIDLYCESEDPEWRNPEAAVELALDVVEKNPHNSLCLAALAKSHAYSGQFEKAVARQRDAIRENGRAVSQPGEGAALEAALAHYLAGEVAPSRRPGDPPDVPSAAYSPPSKQSMAIALKKEAIKYSSAKGDERDIPRAIALHKQAYELCPEAYTAFRIGELYLWQEPYRDHGLARKWLDIAIAEDYHRAHLCLATYYYRAHDHSVRDGAKALYHARMAAGLEAGDFQAHRILAEACAFNGNHAEAVQSQERAIELALQKNMGERYIDQLRKKLQEYRRLAANTEQ